MPENETHHNTVFTWSPNECDEYPIHVHTLPKNGITQIMRHDDILKWAHDGHKYCLHVQKDNHPVDPILENTLVNFVDYNEHDEMNPEPVIDNRPKATRHRYFSKLKYWQNKLAETLDSDTIAKINTNNVSDCIAALQDNFVILPFRVIHLSYEEISNVSTILSIDSRDYSDPYFVTSDTSWCDPYWIHSWAIISKKNILETWPETDDWKKKGEEVMQSLITQHNLYFAGSCWQYTLLKKTYDGKWEKIEHNTHFLGEDIIQSGMVNYIGRGLLDAIASKATTKDRPKTYTSYTYD